MSLRIAFAGASGTGKTTLATFLAEALGLPLCPVGSRSVAASMGFDSPYDVDKAGRREEFQQRLMAGKISWEEARSSFITDRTPLDNVAYSLMHAPDLVDADYLRDALEYTRDRYDVVFFLPVVDFQAVGDDPARMDSETYHWMFSETLAFLLLVAGVRVVRPEGKTLPDRKADVLDCVVAHVMDSKAYDAEDVLRVARFYAKNLPPNHDAE